MNYNSYKIGAIIIGYNNVTELRNCIDSIIKQTVKVKHIIIVDNSDIDYKVKNQAMLKEFNEIGHEIFYTSLDENIGSAGGYSVGMDIADKYGLDFIWLNDQDGVADRKCLSSLLDVYKETGKDGIYAPQIIDIEGNYQLSYFRTHVNSFLNQVNVDEIKTPFFNIDIAGTTGILVSSGVIKTIGVYNSNVFFVGNEDVEYCLRAKKNNFPIYLVNKAKYFHPDLLKKYDVKERWITKLNFPYALRPLNLGAVVTETKRESAYCKGAAYINEVYNPFIIRKINFYYSIIRCLILKLAGKNVKLKKTLAAYREGKYIALKNNVNYRVGM